MNIVITGASRGIGKAIAAKFITGSAVKNLFLIARNAEILNQTIEELKKLRSGINIFAAPCDLSDKKSIVTLSEKITGSVEHIDVLINNAGGFLPGTIQTEEDGTLENMLENNLYSAYYLTRNLLPYIKKSKAAHIFNMCSIASLQAYPNGGSYSISKYALMGFSKNLRLELMPLNIKVTTVYPGAVYTDAWKSSGVELERIISADDIAELIVTAAGLSAGACLEEIVIRPLKGDL